MAYRTDDRARRVTLCKRKKGLYKKAEELAKLCGVEVAVVIVGDGCKPAQMVATGHANYNDLPTCFRVLSRYSDAVGHEMPEAPEAALDARETLTQQHKELERQRREIEDLKRQLAVHQPSESAPTSSMAGTPPESHTELMETSSLRSSAQTPPRPKKRKLANRLEMNKTQVAGGETDGQTEVDGAMAEMDGAMAEMDEAMAQVDGAMAEGLQRSASKEMELMGVDDMEDAFEFDGQKRQLQHAPWSGFPMVAMIEQNSTLGACVP